MYIKRKNNNFANSNSNQMFSSKGLGKYVYPYECKVPSGLYISIVKHATPTITSSGKKGIMVCYKIKHAPTLYDIINEKSSENTHVKTYYIKQCYPEGTEFYYAFLDSMSEALETETFTMKDTIGVIEYVTLSYEGKDKIGGYSKRTHMTWEEFVDFCIDIEQEKNNSSGNYTDNYSQPVVSDENCNVNIPDEVESNPDNSECSDEEYDEFDDFLPDDDEDW